MKMWNVRFRKIMDKKWIVCEKPFSSKLSADLFAQTIQITSPYVFEVETFMEESCSETKDSLL